MAEELKQETAEDPTEKPPLPPILGMSKELFRQHPALIVSLGYIITSLIGMMFSWQFFKNFDVNIFDYAEITDFLMAALREPMSIVLALGGVLVTLLVWMWSSVELRWFQKHPPTWRISKAYSRWSRWGMQSTSTHLFVIVAYAFLFIEFYVAHQVDRIRAGEGDRIRIEQDSEADMSALLVGSTSKFLLVATGPDSNVVILPHESITRITVLAE